MFSKKKIIKSTSDYWDNLKKLKEQIENADAIIIGAGAGLSASAGLEYGGKRFYDNFSDFAEKYGLQDMYSAGFYPFETPVLHARRLWTVSMLESLPAGNIR